MTLCNKLKHYGLSKHDLFVIGLRHKNFIKRCIRDQMNTYKSIPTRVLHFCFSRFLHLCLSYFLFHTHLHTRIRIHTITNIHSHTQCENSYTALLHTHTFAELTSANLVNCWFDCNQRKWSINSSTEKNATLKQVSNLWALIG